jgi:hypothetical protein
VNRPSRLGFAAGASATASLACVPTWHEDFRKDLARIDVPTLVITAMRTAFYRSLPQDCGPTKLIRGARHLVVKGGLHCVTWTHADEVNPELVNFLGVAKRAGLSTREGSSSVAVSFQPLQTGCRLKPADPVRLREYCRDSRSW